MIECVSVCVFGLEFILEHLACRDQIYVSGFRVRVIVFGEEGMVIPIGNVEGESWGEVVCYHLRLQAPTRPRVAASVKWRI